MKKKLVRYTLVLGGLLPLVAVSPAFADMFYQLTPTPTGGVSVVGSGSGFADRDPNQITSNWDTQDFITDFLKDTVSASEIDAGTVAGTIKNVTTDITENINRFRVDRDTTSNDDLIWDIPNAITFSLGDEFLFQLTATFNVGTLAYADLIEGVHIDNGRTMPPAGIADEIFGVTTLTVVPDPATLGLLLAGVISLGSVGWRRRRR